MIFETFGINAVVHVQIPSSPLIGTVSSGHHASFMECSLFWVQSDRGNTNLHCLLAAVLKWSSSGMADLLLTLLRNFHNMGL
jgi:hypothetical protein